MTHLKVNSSFFSIISTDNKNKQSQTLGSNGLILAFGSVMMIDERTIHAVKSCWFLATSYELLAPTRELMKQFKINAVRYSRCIIVSREIESLLAEHISGSGTHLDS